MKIELHLHTAESSKCSKVGAEQIIREYHRCGYGAVVITDHYARGTFEKPDVSGLDKTERFLRGYREAKKWGDELGVKVFLGAELRFSASNANDYLCYGLDEEFFYEHCDLDIMRLSDFERIKPAKALLYQAHPFRNGITVTDPKRLFGIEVFNGHVGHDSRNSIALQWARLHKLHAISGSDSHHRSTLCNGGIITNEDVLSMDDLLKVLRTDSYALFNKNVLDSLHW